MGRELAQEAEKMAEEKAPRADAEETAEFVRQRQEQERRVAEAAKNETLGEADHVDDDRQRVEQQRPAAEAEQREFPEKDAAEEARMEFEGIDDPQPRLRKSGYPRGV